MAISAASIAISADLIAISADSIAISVKLIAINDIANLIDCKSYYTILLIANLIALYAVN